MDCGIFIDKSREILYTLVVNKVTVPLQLYFSHVHMSLPCPVVSVASNWSSQGQICRVMFSSLFFWTPIPNDECFGNFWKWAILKLNTLYVFMPPLSGLLYSSLSFPTVANQKFTVPAVLTFPRRHVHFACTWTTKTVSHDRKILIR